MSNDKILSHFVAALVGALLLLLALDARAQSSKLLASDFNILRHNYYTCIAGERIDNARRRGVEPPSWTPPTSVHEPCMAKALEIHKNKVDVETRFWEGIVGSAPSGVRQAPAPVYPGERKEYKNVEDRKMIEQFSAGLSAAGQAAVRQHYAEGRTP